MPNPDLSGSVEGIKLRSSPGGEARRAEKADAPNAVRPRRGAKSGQRGRARPAARRESTHPGSTSGADGGRRAVAGPLGQSQSGDAPAGGRRRDAPVSTRPRSQTPAPRTPVPRSPATTPGGSDAPAPQVESEPAASEPADSPGPVDPPDPAEEDPTTAAVDPPVEQDPVGGDPAEAP